VPSNSIELPTNPESLALVVNRHFDRERQRQMPQLTLFRLVWEYLAGARRFDVINLENGQVRAFQTDKDGRMEFHGSDFLRAIDQMVGYIRSYDLMPKAYGEGHSLSSIKESATAQVLADAAFSSDDVETAGTQFAHLLISYGSCGIMAHVQGQPANGVGLTADLEVVPPFEIVPFPSVGSDLTKLRGIGREYFIPMTKLVEMKGQEWVDANRNGIYGFRVRAGTEPYNNPDMATVSSWWTSEGGNLDNVPAKTPTRNPDEANIEYVRLRYLWLDGPKGTCSRKVCVSGRVVVEDMDFKNVEAYCPLGFARFIENGTFFGAGAYHVLFSVSRQLELMHKTLFNDTIERDRFGYLVIPQGSFNLNQNLKETGRGIKAITWEPDGMTDNGQRPFVVEPASVGDSAVKTAVYAKNYFDTINPLIDIVREKGRVDSERGLAFLQERVDQAMTSPTRGIIKAFGQMYKAALAKAASELVVNANGGGALPIPRLTLDLAGAIIDWDKGEVSFPRNPIPTFSRLRVRPKLTGSKSIMQRKMEGMNSIQAMMTTPLKVLIKGLEEGWDFAFYTDGEAQAYQAIIRQILTLYADGTHPGQLLVNPSFVRPDIQLVVLDAFMGSQKMMVASVDVQDQFIKFRGYLMQQSGQALPPGLNYNPDDMAAVMQGQQGAAQALQQPMMR